MLRLGRLNGGNISGHHGIHGLDQCLSDKLGISEDLYEIMKISKNDISTGRSTGRSTKKLGRPHMLEPSKYRNTSQARPIELGGEIHHGLIVISRRENLNNRCLNSIRPFFLEEMDSLRSFCETSKFMAEICEKMKKIKGNRFVACTDQRFSVFVMGKLVLPG